MSNIQKNYDQMQRLSLLLVEDEKLLRLRTAEILEDYFYRVETAIDGIDALEKFNAYYKLKNKYYDLVISDIQMPRMDGVALVKQLYALREDQPIVILSAHTETEYLLSLINLGVAQFITKPIQYQEMLDMLHKVCSKINIISPVISVSSHLILLDEGVVWDTKKKLLVTNGSETVLTRYEIHLMEILTSKFEKVCSTDDILNHFYINNIDISSESLRGMTMRLRKKLPDKTLSSIYGLGYRLTFKQD